MEATRIYLVRHGETVWNREKRWQGHIDKPLNETGIKQAEAVADFFEEHTCDVIYSSDLRRAYDTADASGSRIGVGIIKDERLREKHMGIMQGLSVEEFKKNNRIEYDKMMSNPSGYIIPEGETMEEFRDRVISCLKEIISENPGKTAAVFCHGGNLNVILRHILDIPLTVKRSFSIFNGSIARLTCNEEGIRLDSWGITDHLKKLEYYDGKIQF